MKIIVEANIPYIKGILEPVATVEYLSADCIDKCAVHDVDALLVRTRTQCNDRLLAGSCCRFIGTATIGTDHIDKDYCKQNGISVHSAPGCNAPAVAQYVISSIGYWLSTQQNDGSKKIQDITLGVVGVGNVGSIVARWAKSIGFKVLLNDPPRRRVSNCDEFVSLERIQNEADIITFHTPLTTSGVDKTYHLCDSDFINSLRCCQLIINSARGGIVDNGAMVDALKCGIIKDAIIDCWENEPCINRELLDGAFIATPHIAGYSAEGKMRATSMILQSLKDYFKLEIDVPVIATSALGASFITMQSIMKSYNPLDDTRELKAHIENFENLRNTYDLRHEVK